MGWRLVGRPIGLGIGRVRGRRGAGPWRAAHFRVKNKTIVCIMTPNLASGTETSTTVPASRIVVGGTGRRTLPPSIGTRICMTGGTRSSTRVRRMEKLTRFLAHECTGKALLVKGGIQTEINLDGVIALIKTFENTVDETFGGNSLTRSGKVPGSSFNPSNVLGDGLIRFLANGVDSLYNR